MQMERFAARLNPPMSSLELSDQLMNKLPIGWKHIATTIRAVVRDMSNFDTPNGVKEMFIDLVTEERRVEQRRRLDRPRREAYSMQLMGTGPPEEKSALVNENNELRKSLLKTTGLRVGGKKATYNRRKPGDRRQNVSQNPKKRPQKKFDKENDTSTTKKFHREGSHESRGGERGKGRWARDWSSKKKEDEPKRFQLAPKHMLFPALPPKK